MTAPHPDVAPAPTPPPAPAPPAAPSGDGALVPKFAESPILPVAIMLIGAYLTWFGVHYWRSDVKWPTDPIKAVLTGKPIPDATNTSDQTAVDTFGKMLHPDPNAGEGTGPGPGQTSEISADALKYVGAGYVFGGPADKPGNWDCSSFVSYVLGHDLHLPLPGGHWGDPGFPPHAHGPTTLQYLVYGTPINRGDVSPGDLVVWPEHMGIAINKDQIVAARSTATGTGTGGIDDVSVFFGNIPHFRRVKT